MIARAITRTMLATYLVLVIAPLCLLAIDASTTLVADPTTIALMIPSGRSFDLLLDSILRASLCAVSTTIIAFIAALGMTTGPLSRLHWLRWVPLIFLPLPPYVHALVWQFQGLNPWALDVQSGTAMTVWVEIMAYLPIGLIGALSSLSLIPRRAVEAARTFRSDFSVLLRIVLPLCAPLLVASTALIFVLSLSSYDVPSLFAVPSAALEIFAEFSVNQDSGRASLVSLPLLFISAVVVIPSLAALRTLELRSDHAADLGDWRWPLPFRLVQAAALVLLALQLLVPAIGLVRGSAGMGSLLSSAADSRSEIAYSAIIASLVVLTAIPLAAVVATRFNRFRFGWWCIALLPLALPGPLIGVLLLRLSNAILPGELLDTPLLPVAASVLRFTPCAILLFVATARRRFRDQIDAVRVFQTSPVHGWTRIRLRLWLPIFAAAAMLLGSFSLGELGATLMLVPPGRSTLAIRIYNYLHYGASESVSGLSLILVLAIGTAGGGAISILRLRQAEEIQ